MVFGFLRGEFIDVISWLDDTRDTMVWRFERHDNAIKYGAKLTVREGQAAVFVNEGQIADIFGPGLYELQTNNMPIMTTLQHWDHAFSSPFKAEIYFVNTTRFNDQKWGTKNPIMCRDPEFGPVRIRAFGTYAMRVADPGLFLREIVGTDGEFTADEVSDQIRNVIVQQLGQVLAKSNIPVLDMAANAHDLGRALIAQIEPAIAAYGLSLPEFYIENVSLPEEVEKVLDKRTSMGIAGDLGKYMQFNAAEGLAQPGSTMGATMGAAMGAGMAAGLGLGQTGPWGAAPTAPMAAPPPPPAPGKAWHLAVNGATQGPFAEADLAQMAARGQLTGQTQVWAAGQSGWQPAELTELARLFAAAPPPPPPPAPPPGDKA